MTSIEKELNQHLYTLHNGKSQWEQKTIGDFIDRELPSLWEQHVEWLKKEIGLLASYVYETVEAKHLSPHVRETLWKFALRESTNVKDLKKNYQRHIDVWTEILKELPNDPTPR